MRKRRFSGRPCGRPFTEPVPGIVFGYRSTERYRRSVLWACENFSDLTQVRHINRRRRLVEGDRRSAALRRLLLRSRFNVEYADRLALEQWLALTGIGALGTTDSDS